MINPFATKRETVRTSPHVSDSVRETTCYMCACRCGIRVHLDGAQVRYIEGNPDHPVNRGVICAKGAAGIMNHNAPARLRSPLLRTGERGRGAFREISWDEALATATEWLAEVRGRDPRRLAFYTGRDQSQALTGWWAKQYGTPNYAAHGGFCSVNMAAAGLYTLGSSFWEFGEPDWAHTRYLMLFGVAEDHASNPIKIGLGQLKSRENAKVVSVNPVRTGYSAIADEWVGLRPGTDGLFVLALVHELLRAERIDWDYLVRYTNAPWLVIDAPGTADDGLFARDGAGAPLAFDTARNDVADAMAPGIVPALVGARTLPDGRRARPVFELIVERYLDPAHAPDHVAETVGIDAARIRRIARELAEAAFESNLTLEEPWTDWAGRRHESVTGRPVAIHAMRGISAHANGFQTCRAIHLLQLLLGAVDTPGAFRAAPPFPKPIPAGPPPAGRTTQPNTPLDGMPLGFPAGPEHLLVEPDGTPLRLDHAFSWEYPLAAHGAMHLMLHNAWAGDPHTIDLLFLYMANMSWNSAMNVPETLRYLTEKDETGAYRIPKIIYADAFESEMVAYADLILPDTTYLERWDCISLLDRPISEPDGPADAIRQPVVAPDRDVRPFQDVLIDLGARLALPGFVDDAGAPRYPGGYADYMVNHERAPGIGPLAGWRGVDGEAHGTGAPNPAQLDRYRANGCFWHRPFAPGQRYLKHANRDYLDHARAMGWIPEAAPIVMQLYSETLQRFRRAARGFGDHQPPEHLRARVAQAFDPLPVWHDPTTGAEDYPLHAVTQRPMHMYHAWGSQNAWLRQITSHNRLYVHPATAAASGLGDGDWAWIVSPLGRVKAQIGLMAGVNPHTVWTWNAIGKRAGAWGLDTNAPEARLGFLLNHLIPDVIGGAGEAARANADPVTGQAAWYDLRVRLERCTPQEAGETAPLFESLPPQAAPDPRPDLLRFGGEFDRSDRGGAAPPMHREWVGNRDAHAGRGVGLRPGERGLADEDRDAP